MLRPHVLINIGNYEFKYCYSGNIVSGWQNFTDTATIEIPNRFLKNGQTIVGGNDNVFKRGDSVKIQLGYFNPDRDNNGLETYFSGYVSKISPGQPFKIECQDLMFLLKQITVSKSWKSVSLKTLLSEILPSNIGFEAVDAELGSFAVTRVNVVQILEELKKTYGLQSYVQNDKLYVGLAYKGNGKTHKFHFQKNIISDDLQFVREDDTKIKLTAISIQPDNSKIKIETGDSDGDSRTLTYYDLTTEELQKIADREIKLLKYTGVAGTFTTFGSPKVNHGDVVELVNDIWPEKSGKYYVDEVSPSFGTGGFRQKIKLGRKA